MIDVVAGIMMMSGGSMLVASSVTLVRGLGPNASELAIALPFTPVPPPDDDLAALVASID